MSITKIDDVRCACEAMMSAVPSVIWHAEWYAVLQAVKALDEPQPAPTPTHGFCLASHLDEDTTYFCSRLVHHGGDHEFTFDRHDVAKLPAPTPQVAAPPAATPARERLRQDVKRRETRCNGTFDDIQALLNEPAAADGWEAMRELRVWLVAKLNERNDDSAKESHEGNRRYYAGMASECYEARVELDRLLSRSPAAQAKEAT